jgi:hypothetical protein
MADLGAAPEGSVIVLHGCAHNPTGVDPTLAQWGAIADLCIARKFVPFFDVAYQGFATGDLEGDAAAPRLFAARGMELFVAQSYSKNLGLYAERIGALNLLAAGAPEVGRALSQLKRIARAQYSNPPVHGARLVAEIVGDRARPALRPVCLRRTHGVVLARELRIACSSPRTLTQRCLLTPRCLRQRRCLLSGRLSWRAWRVASSPCASSCTTRWPSCSRNATFRSSSNRLACSPTPG